MSKQRTPCGCGDPDCEEDYYLGKKRDSQDHEHVFTPMPNPLTELDSRTEWCECGAARVITLNGEIMDAIEKYRAVANAIEAWSDDPLAADAVTAIRALIWRLEIVMGNSERSHAAHANALSTLAIIKSELEDAEAKVDLLEIFRDRLKSVRDYLASVPADHDPDLEAIVNFAWKLSAGATDSDRRVTDE